jgi:hypothetical protein
MDLTPERKAEIEQNLIENELMRQGDEIIHSENGDYWEKFLCFYMQTRGCYYCTKEALVFVGGFAGSTFWSVRYSDIKKYEKNLKKFAAATKTAAEKKRIGLGLIKDLSKNTILLGKDFVEKFKEFLPASPDFLKVPDLLKKL